MDLSRIQALADLVLEHTRRQLAEEASQWQADAETVSVVPGRKYTKIDRGVKSSLSGYLMVEHETGIIYGIKGYGVPDRRYRYGTLDTIDGWNWGGYGPEPAAAAPEARS
jgi:hypothetical protein